MHEKDCQDQLNSIESMARIITCATMFQGNHPRKGQPTYFVEKIVGGLVANVIEDCGTELIKSLRDSRLLSIAVMNELEPDICFKHHTFRRGSRWKVGEKFSPRIWTGLPYRSPQRQFAPDLEIKKIWTLEYKGTGKDWYLDGRVLTVADVTRIANNDGLDLLDFIDWFPKPVKGQLICWNENIEY